MVLMRSSGVHNLHSTYEFVFSRMDMDYNSTVSYVKYSRLEKSAPER